jgi:hypothetical protein
VITHNRFSDPWNPTANLPCSPNCFGCQDEAAQAHHPFLYRLARTQPIKFVRDHVRVWWWWRDLTVGVTIGTGLIHIHLPCVAVEIGRKEIDWWSE